MATKSKIADDWEDVVDETYSVVSLPSDSDDETPVLVHRPKSQPQPNQSTSDPSESLPAPSATSTGVASSSSSSGAQARIGPSTASLEPPQYGSRLVQTPDNLTDASVQRENDGDHGSRAGAYVHPAEAGRVIHDIEQYRVYDDDDDEGEDEHEHEDEDPARGNEPGEGEAGDSYDGEGSLAESVDELIERRVNPTFLLNTLNSVAQVLHDTTSVAAELESTAPLTVQRITWICNMLSRQFLELKPITAGYAKYWEARNVARPAPSDIPLDPSLYDWMSGLRVKLLAVQAEIQKHAATRGRMDPLPSAAFGADLAELEQHIDALSEFEKHMDDFLPIIQVDFNEYETQHMEFATQPSRQPDRWSGLGPRRYGSLPQTDLTRIRTELYGLKDELQITLEKMQGYRRCLPLLAAAVAGEIASSFAKILNAVSLALTNHGSEWLDWGIAGGRDGLTHAEFCALDASSIAEFTERLRQICEILDIERDPQIGSTWSEQMIRDHRAHMLLEEGQLDALESVAAILTAIMVPERG